MSARSSARAMFCVTCAGVALVLAGCSGGGGGASGGVISSPGPVPTPTPSPTPTPTPTNFDTSEYRRSDGPVFHGAISAWQAGASGLGTTIAIIDTGIDTDSPEFAGRISAASADVAGNGTIEAVDDHGTLVALVAAAARDNTGVVGIAYNAMLQVLRTDKPGSCTASGTSTLDGCAFTDRDIAAGVDRAVTAGATVINISLGGSAPTTTLRDAVRRAAAAGVVIVVSAGNDGGSTDPAVNPNEPDPFAAGLVAAGSGNVIIAGSVDQNGVFSTFSNRAGSEASAFLAARGEAVCCVYENGVLKVGTRPNGSTFVTLFSGTSFSAPQVAGAVALLKQAFPNLSGTQIVKLLLDSARDAGAAGTDPIYGRGILDIAKAFAPAGTTTLAGTGIALSPADSIGIGSSAMGDALGQQGLSAIITDSYARAYTADLARGLQPAAQRRPLAGAVATQGQQVALAAGPLALAFTVGRGGDSLGGGPVPLRLNPRDADRARVLAAHALVRLAPGTELALGFAEPARTLVARLQRRGSAAFLLAPEAGSDGGPWNSADSAFALRRQIGRWGLTLSAEAGAGGLGNRRLGSGAVAGAGDFRPVQSFAVVADRRIGALDAAIGLTWQREQGTVLGGWFHPALGVTGADTLFLDAYAGLSPAPDWRIGAAARYGRTVPQGAGVAGAGAVLDSSAWSLDVTRAGVFAGHDQLGLRIAQPLRVERGGLLLDLPVAYDYASASPVLAPTLLSLRPRGRELIGELAWQSPLWGGSAAASVYYRREPGHVAHAPDDAGLALRWNLDF